jgi:hypothetical protein
MISCGFANIHVSYVVYQELGIENNLFTPQATVLRRGFRPAATITLHRPSDR